MKNILNLNKTMLLVTTSLVVSGCSTVAQQQNDSDTSSKSAVSENTDEKNTSGLSAKRMMSIADRAWKKGNATAALRFYSMAGQKAPNDTAPYVAIGDILRKTKRADAAIDVYKSVLKKHPDTIAAHTGIGYSLLNLSKPYLAAQSFEAAIALDPKNGKSLGGMAVALDTAGEHEKAQDYYRLAIKATPNNLTYQNNLALSLALAGRTDQAIAMLEIITAHPHATAQHRQNLALVYGMAGKSADAMRYSRMDLSDRDAKNNALYFQALNKAPTTTPNAQEQQVYAMASDTNKRHRSLATSRTTYTPLMPKEETVALNTVKTPLAPKKSTPYVPYTSDDVQIAKDPAPAHIAVAGSLTPTEKEMVAAAPVAPVKATALEQPAPDKKIKSGGHIRHASLSGYKSPAQVKPVHANIADDFVLEPVTLKPARLAQTKSVTTASDRQYYAQVGSFRTEERAQNGWNILLTKHSDLLAEHKPVFTKVELGEEKGGTFYRVRIGGFEGKSTPLHLCQSLRDRNQDCYMPIVSSSSFTSVEKIDAAPAATPKTQDVIAQVNTELQTVALAKNIQSKKEKQVIKSYDTAYISY